MQRVAECVLPFAVGAGTLPGQVRQEARRDRLEEDERRPGDEEDVEHESGRGGALGGADEQRPGADQDLFAEHHQQHRPGEGAAAAERQVGAAGELAGRRHRRVAAGHQRDHQQPTERRDRDPDRDRRRPVEDPDRDEDSEHQPSDDLADQQRRVDREPPLAGEIAAGEVGEGEPRKSDEHRPVEVRVGAEQPLLERRLHGQQHHQGRQADAELDPAGRSQRVPGRRAGLVALGERPGEELLDRAVERRGDDEDDRPEDDDLAVLVLAEASRGEDEEDVGEDAADAEGDGQARGRAPVGAGLASDGRRHLSVSPVPQPHRNRPRGRVGPGGRSVAASVP